MSLDLIAKVASVVAAVWAMVIGITKIVQNAMKESRTQSVREYVESEQHEKFLYGLWRKWNDELPRRHR